MLNHNNDFIVNFNMTINSGQNLTFQNFITISELLYDIITIGQFYQWNFPGWDQRLFIINMLIYKLLT